MITFKNREQFLEIESSLMYATLLLLNSSGTQSMSYLSTISTTYRPIGQIYSSKHEDFEEIENIHRIILKQVEIYTLIEARSVTSPTGMKMKPISRNVAMTCIEYIEI